MQALNNIFFLMVYSIHVLNLKNIVISQKKLVYFYLGMIIVIVIS